MRGVVVLLLVAIWVVKFYREQGIPLLWGALTGGYIVA